MPRGTSIYDEAYLQERLWFPTNIASLAGWWDASDPTTMTFSTGISQWNSKVGSAYVAQATGAAQPTLNATTRTGAPGVNFSGAQNLTYSGAPSGFNTGTSAMTAVVSGTSFSGSLTDAFFYGSASAGRARILAVNSNNVLVSVYSGDLATGVAWLNTGRVVTGRWPSGTSVTMQSSVSGTDGSLGVTAGSVGAALAFGSDVAGSYKFTGIIHDVMFFNEALSTADVRRVEGYLAWKANTQGNLTGTHPYKNRPPMIGD